MQIGKHTNLRNVELDLRTSYVLLSNSNVYDVYDPVPVDYSYFTHIEMLRSIPKRGPVYKRNVYP